MYVQYKYINIYHIWKLSQERPSSDRHIFKVSEDACMDPSLRGAKYRLILSKWLRVLEQGL